MTMADTNLYETDILAWSEQQTSALRELAQRRDLPNALDLTHVLEQIGDVGLSELNAVRSFIQLILRHAVKCIVDPDERRVRHWHVEISNWQGELERRISRSMHQRIDLDMLWDRAVRQAELDLLDQSDQPSAVDLVRLLRGTPCPISLDSVLLDATDPGALVRRVMDGLRACNAIAWPPSP